MEKRISARAIIFIGDSIVSMYRENDGRKYYTFPGGGVEKGETFEQCVTREAFEEFGLRVKPLKKVYICESEKKIDHFFICKLLSGKVGDGKGEEFQPDRNRGVYKQTTIKISKIPLLPLMPPVVAQAFVKDYNKNGINLRNRAKKLYDGCENPSDLKLVLPTKKYYDQVALFKQKFLDAGSSFDGTNTLRDDDVSTWLKKCEDYRKGKNLPKGFVSATQYICVRKSDDKLVGMLQIRHQLNDFLLNYGGHIGDCIAVDERGKGYGKQILKLGLKKCKNLGIKKVLITCKDTNIASRKCILANGGKFEDKRQIDDPRNKDYGVCIERYWIEIK